MRIESMTKFRTKFFSILLCSILMFYYPVTAIAADGQETAKPEGRVYLKYVTKYLSVVPGTDFSLDAWEAGDAGYDYVEIKLKLSNDNEINKSSVRSSNEKVVKDLLAWEEKRTIYCDPECHYAFIDGKTNSPGTADITFEDKYGTEYAVRATILAYENPVKSLKMTNVKKGKNLAKFFKNSSYWKHIWLWEKTTKAPKIRVKANPGWYIRSIDMRRGFYESSFSKKEWKRKFVGGLEYTKSKTVKLGKVKKGESGRLTITFYNWRTGAEREININQDFYD